MKRGDWLAKVISVSGASLPSIQQEVSDLSGVPINASLNMVSALMAGNQARKYFSTWDALPDPEINRYAKN